jgi:hypothetical protein
MKSYLLNEGCLRREGAAGLEVGATSSNEVYYLGRRDIRGAALSFSLSTYPWPRHTMI